MVEGLGAGKDVKGRKRIFWGAFDEKVKVKVKEKEKLCFLVCLRRECEESTYRNGEQPSSRREKVVCDRRIAIQQVGQFETRKQQSRIVGTRKLSTGGNTSTWEHRAQGQEMDVQGSMYVSSCAASDKVSGS